MVFVSVPHTKKSEGMMGARQFELMKQGSYFIAMSRGKIYRSRRRWSRRSTASGWPELDWMRPIPSRCPRDMRCGSSRTS